MEDLTGKTLGPYEIMGPIAHGGMADVYRGMQPSIGREVAIKVLPAHFLQDRTFLERFYREVRLIAQLQHPRILPIHDFGEEEGRAYIVSAYMPGGTLAERIRRYPGGLPVDEVLYIIRQIAEGLNFAHKNGVIHRDFKPGNVLFDADDNVYLADFGIARATETTAQLTGSGIVGTPAYMAPEMSNRDGITTAVDIYALGITLFQLFTGQLPYDAETPMGLLMAHVSKDIPDVLAARPDLPPGIQVVIKRAMAKDPRLRYANAGDLVADLESVLSGAGPLDSETLAFGAEQPEQEYSSDIYRIETQDAVVVVEPPTRQPSNRRGLLLPVVGGLFGLIVISGLILAVLRPFDRAEEASPTEPISAATVVKDTPTESPPTETIPPTATQVSLMPSITRQTGTVEILSGDSGDFSLVSLDQTLQLGDTIRTGNDGAAQLTLVQGVQAEIHPNSSVVFERLELTDNVLLIELRQLSGTAYHSIQSEENPFDLLYILHTPNAVVEVTGTAFWADEVAEGWCFDVTDGSLLIDPGERDENADDDIRSDVSDPDPVLVDSSGVVGTCDSSEGQNPLFVGEDPVVIVTDEPTPLAGGGAAVCGDGFCNTSFENTDLCPQDCSCVDDGVCAPGEGIGCVDCGDSAGGCGAPCSDSSTCTGGLVCAGGVCWDQFTCSPDTPGGGGGGDGGDVSPPQPGCGSCGDGGSSTVTAQCSRCLYPAQCITQVSYDSCGNTCSSSFQGCTSADPPVVSP